MPRDIEDLHAEACCRGDSIYIDPVTGYSVFTSVGLKKKGTCCGSGCRHCPYGRMNCPPRRAPKDTTPLEYRKGGSGCGDEQRETAVVFFSGGKDSFLSLYHARQRYNVVLLSTYDPTLQMNGIQRVPIDRIREFASTYQLDLVTIPVSTDTLPYPDMIEKGLALIQASKPTTHISCLVFGDIHLEHIKQWRLDEFSKRLGYECWFPLWNKPYDVLQETLHIACQEYRVEFSFSAIYDDTLREKLNISDEELNGQCVPTYHDSIAILEENNVDVFGEHGEFHTMVTLLGSQ